ncbi:Anaphase-promoting complex subfamily unit 1 C-terminal domain containing protein [Plasmodiophora brassicae]
MDVVLEALPWRAGRHTRYTGDGDAIGIEGRVVYLPDRQLTFDEEVIDAVWAQFDADDVRFLCVLQPETIRIVGSDGRSFDVAIPFKCNAFWALNRGLLLSVPSGHDVYYLGHPLDPFVPVLTQHDVVFASAVPSMVVTHNIETRTHSVFVPTLPSSTLSMGLHACLDLTSANVSRVFLATTEQGEETLCFVADGHVDIFLVGNASRIAVVDGIVDAVPVNSVCGNGVRDMVVLERDGRLSIWTAGQRRCDLNTSPVASIADPAGSELTLVLADGNAFRARLAPMSTYPSRMGFDALCADPDIPRDVLFAIITEFHSSRRGERNSNPGSIADREWRYLSALVVAVVSGRPPTAAPKALGAGQAWAVLLSSDYHADESMSPTFPFDPFSFVDDVSKEVNEFGGSASRHPLGTVILETLHLLYETCKLSTLTACYLRRLASLLIDIARLCGRIDYCAHYARDFGDLYKGFAHGGVFGSVMGPGPFDVNSHLLSYIRRQTPIPDVPHRIRSTSFARMRQVILFYEIIFGQNVDHRFQEFPNVAALGTHAASSRAQCLVLTMVRDGFTIASLNELPFGVAMHLRSALRICRNNPPPSWPAEAYALIGREDLFIDTSTLSSLAPHAENAVCDDDDVSGTSLVVQQSLFRFGRDHRIAEVRRLLRSDCTLTMRIGTWQEMADQDSSQAVQQRLGDLCLRSLALPVGRGMFTFGSIRPVLTEPVPIPPLNLTGVTSKNLTVELDLATYPESWLRWPEFHNGVAAGLRVVQQQSIDRAWVVFQRPVEPTHEHAGLLLALGLQGHLAGLSRSDLYWYLSKKHDPTTIAVLLGLSASSRGTMDSTVSRMLCLHIPALLPSGFADLDVPILVQTTALLGIGLVYQGTCHRLMSEVLLAEINKRPFLADGSCADREAHALAAGLSLGLVNLGRGDDAPGLADLHIEDCLLELMVGGKDLSLLTAGKRPGSSTATHGRQPSISTSYDPNSKSCLVREATMTNVDVTCPGATLALGLMFLKTNNLHIANRLAPPETNFELESTRPDFLLLRVLSRSLVLWDSIRPSRAWLQSAIPDILSKHDLNDGERNCEVDVFASDACVGDIDVETIRKSYCHIIAGACLALGIRFAGTANASASTLLHEHVSWFQRMKNQAALTRKLDRNTIDTCLATCALGYAVVLAGTGNLDALRLLRSLRRSLDSETSYGFNMALHMSIGLLFLGGGRSSLSTSSPAIAALVIALFPRFPMSTTDNRDHVQAFRHLYVLAVEPRYLETRDVDNGRPCYVPLVVQLSHGEQRNIIAPCLLPSPDTVESIRVESPRFWPLVLDLKGSDAHKSLVVQNGVMFVKRKTGHLPYRQDPLGRRGILSRSFPRLTHLSSGKQSQRRAAVHREAFVESFAADSVLVEFAKDFCGEGTPSGEFSTAVLFECLTRDTPDMIPTYFAVYEIVNDLARQVNSLGIWQIKFALELCSSQSGSPNGNVIQEEFLMAVRSHLHAYFSSPEFDAALSHYIGQSGSYPSTPMFGYSQSTTAVLFSMFLTFFDIPLHAKLSQCLDSLRQWPPGGNFLPKLSRMFPTVPVQGLVRIERAVKAMRLHAEQVA